jgi:hypothetical protein
MANFCLLFFYAAPILTLASVVKAKDASSIDPLRTFRHPIPKIPPNPSRMRILVLKLTSRTCKKILSGVLKNRLRFLKNCPRFLPSHIIEIRDYLTCFLVVRSTVFENVAQLPATVYPLDTEIFNAQLLDAGQSTVSFGWSTAKQSTTSTSGCQTVPLPLPFHASKPSTLRRNPES